MRLVYTGQDIGERSPSDRAIFLAGPNPRAEGVSSWRPQAIALLESFLFGGIVIVPEHPVSNPLLKAPEDIYGWEWAMLKMHADVVAFWVPRDMNTLPGLTTNIEFGMLMDSGRLVFGAPPSACDVSYMRWSCAQRDIPCAKTLEATVHLAVLKAASEITYSKDGR